MGHKETIFDGILNGNMKAVQDATTAALDEGIAAGELLNEAMIPAMAEVGRLFEANEYYVPEMLIAARAMQAGLAVLKPRLAQANIQSAGKIVAGTVKGDLHDIGKNLVCMMLEGAAFEIIDLGSDVSPDKFVEAVRSSGANIVALSALLTTTMPNMAATIAALEAAGLRQQVKVMIGGAPTTPEWAQEIKADLYAPDAGSAPRLIAELLK